MDWWRGLARHRWRRLSESRLVIRAFAPEDLPAARAVWRSAFAAQFGLSPEVFRPGADVLARRLAGQPGSCFVAVDNGQVVGSVVGLDWGSVWILGPLTVDPAAQARGHARALVEAFLSAAGDRLVGLWTFPNSVKHLGLYHSVGFESRSLVAVGLMAAAKGDQSLVPADWQRPDGVFAGLDLSREPGGGSQIVGLADGAALAVVQHGAASEADVDQLYCKFAWASDASALAALLVGLRAMAAGLGLGQVKLGVNLARRAAHRVLREAGWVPRLVGVAMHRPDVHAWDRAEVLVLDDWQ